VTDIGRGDHHLIATFGRKLRSLRCEDDVAVERVGARGRCALVAGGALARSEDPSARSAMRRALVAGAALGIAAAVLATVIALDDGDSRRADPRLIPQPPLSLLNARTRRRLAPASKRVDLVAPTFSSRSTRITNPLFPVSELRSAILLGKLDGAPWRAETTLLPGTETIAWNGMRVKTLRSQFVAYLRGRIFEVAVDRYAQADDGSVWYFGEDAYTYERGRISDREGTWLAGVDGPPAMIMPAHPRVGDVYRTENIPGTVFEQVTIEAVGEAVRGPTGPVQGAITGRELHMDEARLERKTFAPGYGEFFSGGGRTFEATALVVPADAVKAPIPHPLAALARDASRVFLAARARAWPVASAGVARVGRDAGRLRGQAVPERLAHQLGDAVAALRRAVEKRAWRTSALAALDVAAAGLDVQLRYRPAAAIERGRLSLWTLRRAVDAAAADPPAVRGDAATLRWIRQRLSSRGR
jgi:hypothetical protein